MIARHLGDGCSRLGVADVINATWETRGAGADGTASHDTGCHRAARRPAWYPAMATVVYYRSEKTQVHVWSPRMYMFGLVVGSVHAGNIPSLLDFRSF